MNAIAMHAEWIVPLDAPVLHDGWIVVERGRIVYVGEELPLALAGLTRVELGRGAVLPGWVNAHCHLEFSDLLEPISMPPQGTIVEWLQAVMAYRRAHSASDAETLAAFRAGAIASGVMEAWRTGTRWIVDNATMPWESEWLAQAKRACLSGLSERVRETLVPTGCIEVQTCFEVVDVRRDRWEATWKNCLMELDRSSLDTRASANFAESEQDTAPKFQAICGIAPHAPYTASLQATQRSLDECKERGVLWSMHLAESSQERQWLEARSGPFADWISPFVDAEHRAHLGTVDAHLQRAAASGVRGLVVHGNDLNPKEMDRIADAQGRLAVVYCPRTHAFFGCGPHPWLELERMGIPVFLGTDSRASTPDLSMWNECKKATERLQAKSVVEVLKGASLGPSKFLGLNVGSLSVGARSHLTWLTWQEDAPASLGAVEYQRGNQDAWWREVLQHARSGPLELHPIWSRMT